MSDIHSLAHGYVVDALEPAETREFEQHLSTCAECRREVRELREVTAALADQVAAEPPATLRSSVLAAIAATPQDATPAPSSRSVSAQGSGPGADDTVDLPEGVTPLRSPTHRAESAEAAARPPRRWSTLLVAASVVAALGLGGWAWQSQQELDDTRRESEVAAATNAQLTRLLAAADVQTVHGDFASGGDGVVVLSKSQGQAVLLGDDLQVLPDDEVYQAWLITDPDQPAVSAGTFEPDGSRSVVELPDEAVDTATVAVSVEPDGGSEQPTSDPVFAVNLAQS